MMEFLTSLGHLENVIYTFPILLVLVIAALHIIGLGIEEMFGALGIDFGADADADAHFDVDAHADLDVDAHVDLDVDAQVDVDAHVDVDADTGIDAADLQIDHGILLSSLGFFHLGKVPLGFIIQMLLAFFGLAGLAMHTVVMHSVWPEALEWSTGARLAISWPTAAVASILLTRLISGFIARVAPGGGERPTRFRALAGRVGTVVSGTADAQQGRAEVKDRRGEAHVVFVRLVEGEATLQKGDPIQLVAYEASQNYFRAQAAPAGVR